VHAYVVNLARSLDRRAQITRELQKTGIEYEIVTAVDGRELDMADTALIHPSFVASGVFPAGSAGCALSHLSIYRKITEAGLDVALILEDDVILPADLGQLAEEVGQHLTGAEVALLSVDCPDPVQLSREGVVQLSGGRQLALPIDITQPRSTGAYLITREASERMIKHLLPIRANADAWPFFYREGAIDRLRCVAPLPVPKNADLTSTIGSYSLGTGLRSRLAGPLLRHRIPVLHQILSRRRQRIYDQWGRMEFVSTPFIEMPSRLERTRQLGPAAQRSAGRLLGSAGRPLGSAGRP
jgi:glycosyl transferase family 25